MSKYLVIVESPAKAKTIQKYLGKDYSVIASYGHVRDLPAKKGSVDPDRHFLMTYQLIERNARHVDAIAKALKKSDALLLATDPDREGEAISWHVYELMRERGLLTNKTVQRIFFNEITRTAIQEAVAHPREIVMDLVNAQQARRALDYLVGFNLSPLLWKKVRRGLSAGRVQSPALRLIVEREEAIEMFVAQEYWRLTAQCSHHKVKFDAKLTYFNKEKCQQFTVTTGEQAHHMRDVLLNSSKDTLLVESVEKKQRKRQPFAPFITSTLQQESARKLGFTARKTMMVAQQLYEGVETDAGMAGLITYMRTDSVSLSQEAIGQIRQYMKQQYGASYCPESPRFYKTKSKNAQEAHEAIRPTAIDRTPEQLKSALTQDQFKLYQLIWKRTLASQMVDALLDTVTVDLMSAPGYQWRVTGSTIAFPGFLAVYEEGRDDPKDEDHEAVLPILHVGDRVALHDILASQHFTEPPPRYSEATLVKALEEFDIGRPSTYASIIHTLIERDYVVSEKKRFVPTDVGRIVSRFLTTYFTQYVDYQFTAQLEDTLDAIARGEKEWTPVLEHFWTPFVQKIEAIDEQIRRADVTTERLDQDCPDCGKPLAIRLGKRGRFIGCTAYPECHYTQDLNVSGSTSETTTQDVLEGRSCPKCEQPLQMKSGRYGRFIGCSQYPSCRYIEAIEKPLDTMIDCPKCNQAHLLKRKSRRGKIFYACGAYPTCDYALWHEPYRQPCPQCSWPIVTVKETKRHGKQYVCAVPTCGWTQDIESSSKE